MNCHEWDYVQEAADRIRRAGLAGAGAVPKAGLILGTGLGGLAEEIVPEVTLPYEEIPYFPHATVESHKGRFVLGKLGGTLVAAMDGRFHLYEGYTPAQVTFPVRVLKALGCEILIVSNAAGGLNPLHRKGDIVVIEDHMNFMGVNPLAGPNDERLGPRFPDMIMPYDASLRELALDVARVGGIAVQQGVYAGVLGPNLETRAEYRALRVLGADVVGMSTVPEVLVAVHAGLRVLGFSIITDMCLPDALHPVNIQDILAVAAAAEPRLRSVVLGVLERLGARVATDAPRSASS